MIPMTTLLLLFVVTGSLLAGLSVPLMLGRVPPNNLYGFRVGRTLASPEIWYPANQYSGRLGLALGVTLVVAALALYCVPGISVEVFAWSYLAITLTGLGVLLFLSFRYLSGIPDTRQQ